MLFSTISQPLIFLWMMFCGCIIGLWYGLLAAVRKLMEAGFWLSLICDLVFGAGCAAILIAGLITADHGRIRLYSLIAVLLGAIMTRFALIAPISAAISHFTAFLHQIVTNLAKYRLLKIIFK